MSVHLRETDKERERETRAKSLMRGPRDHLYIQEITLATLCSKTSHNLWHLFEVQQYLRSRHAGLDCTIDFMLYRAVILRDTCKSLVTVNTHVNDIQTV